MIRLEPFFGNDGSQTWDNAIRLTGKRRTSRERQIIGTSGVDCSMDSAIPECPIQEPTRSSVCTFRVQAPGEECRRE